MFEEIGHPVPQPSANGGVEPVRDPVASEAAPVPSEFGDAEEPSPLMEEEDGEDNSPLESLELDEWKQELRRDFESWLESVDSLPPLDIDVVSSTPDLFSFYREFAASTVEARKSNRRTAEAFSQWGETLSRFDIELQGLREQLSRQPIARPDSLPRSWCLALVEILDRLQRLATAFKSPPPRRWWGQDIIWRRAWETQQQALAILIGHTETLLFRAGMTRIPTVGGIFDPTTMVATATESDPSRPHQSVIEELTTGYRLQNELLRVAEVKVSIRPQ